MKKLWGYFIFLLSMCLLLPNMVQAAVKDEVHDGMGILSESDIEHIHAVNQSFRDAGSIYQLWVYTYDKIPDQMQLDMRDADDTFGLGEWAENVAQNSSLYPSDDNDQSDWYAQQQEENRIGQKMDALGILFVYDWKGQKRVTFMPTNGPDGSGVMSSFQLRYLRWFNNNKDVSADNVMALFDNTANFVELNHVQHHVTNSPSWEQVKNWADGMVILWLVGMLLLYWRQHPTIFHNDGGSYDDVDENSESFDEGYTWGYLTGRENNHQDGGFF